MRVQTPFSNNMDDYKMQQGRFVGNLGGLVRVQGMPPWNRTNAAREAFACLDSYV